MKLAGIVDTGASLSVIDETIVEQLKVFINRQSVPSVVGFNGDEVPLVGCADLDIEVGERSFRHRFHVLRRGGPDRVKLVFGNDFCALARLMVHWSSLQVFFVDEYNHVVRKHYVLGEKKTAVAETCLESNSNVLPDMTLPRQTLGDKRVVDMTPRRLKPLNGVANERIFGATLVCQRKKQVQFAREPKLSVPNSTPLGKRRVVEPCRQVLLKPDYFVRQKTGNLFEDNDIFNTAGILQEKNGCEVVNSVIHVAGQRGSLMTTQF